MLLVKIVKADQKIKKVKKDENEWKREGRSLDNVYVMFVNWLEQNLRWQVESSKVDVISSINCKC